MTELEKLDMRIDAAERASVMVQQAASVDRKLSHDKHTSGHFTKALTELGDQLTRLRNLRTRVLTLGK